MSASCLGLRPPAAVTDGWFPPVLAVSSAGLCDASLELHDRAFLLGARWGRLLWACVRLPALWRGQPSAAAPEARWTLSRAGWLSWGLLRLTRGLAIWCQIWRVSSIGETASNRPRYTEPPSFLPSFRMRTQRFNVVKFDHTKAYLSTWTPFFTLQLLSHLPVYLHTHLAGYLYRSQLVLIYSLFYLLIVFFFIYVFCTLLSKQPA